MKSKKRLTGLLLASLALFGKASASEFHWISIASNANGAQFYVDDQNVDTQNGQTYFWGKRTAGISNDAQYAWNISHFVVDCTMPGKAVIVSQTSYRADGSTLAEDHEIHSLEASKGSPLLMMNAVACAASKLQAEKSK